MRKISLLWLFLAAISGGVLFHTSQQVTDGRQRLAVINDDIRKEDETIRVLQAEWSYLNQPDRLEKLSKQYLNLAPLNGRQFAKLDQMPERPAEPAPAPETAPVAEAAPETAPVAEAAPQPEADAPQTAEVVAAPAPKAATPKPAPKPVVAAAPKPAKVKHVPIKPTSAFIVGLHKPAAPKAPKPVATADRAGTQQRDFGYVMKSLGVH